MRIPDEIMSVFRDVPLAPFRPVRVSLGEIPASADRRYLAVQRRDLDPLAHVNNATYLDLATDSLVDQPASPRHWTIEFARPAAAGEELIAHSWNAADGSWRYRLAGSDGTDRFRAVLKTRS